MKSYADLDMRGNRLRNTIDAYPHYDVTEAEYAQMKRDGTLDPHAFYNVTDDQQFSGSEFDATKYYTKVEVDELIRQVIMRWEAGT